MKLIRQYPFTAYNLLALLVEAAVIAAGVQFDAGGLLGLLVLTTPLWGVFFWMPDEMLLTLNHGVAPKGHELAAAALGLGICLLADYALQVAGRKWGAKS